MKILVTGFEPFGGNTINASNEVLQCLPKKINNAKLTKLCLPVSFQRASQIMHEAIVAQQPDLVVCLGQSKKNNKVRLERVALNLMDCANPDNDNHTPQNQPAQIGGQIAYFTQIPIRELCDNLKQEGYDVVLSNSAGTYVCNRVYYEVMFHHQKSLFVHLPLLTEQGGTMSLEEETKIVKSILQKLIAQ